MRAGISVGARRGVKALRVRVRSRAARGGAGRGAATPNGDDTARARTSAKHVVAKVQIGGWNVVAGGAQRRKHVDDLRVEVLAGRRAAQRFAPIGGLVVGRRAQRVHAAVAGDDREAARSVFGRPQLALLHDFRVDDRREVALFAARRACLGILRVASRTTVPAAVERKRRDASVQHDAQPPRWSGRQRAGQPGVRASAALVGCARSRSRGCTGRSRRTGDKRRACGDDAGECPCLLGILLRLVPEQSLACVGRVSAKVEEQRGPTLDPPPGGAHLLGRSRTATTSSYPFAAGPRL